MFTTSVPTDYSSVIRFSYADSSLSSFAITTNAPTATRVLCLGPGEGLDRIILDVTDEETEIQEAIYGRRVYLSDRRDTSADNTSELITQLTSESKTLLARHHATESAEMSLTEDFISDVNPGDWVSVIDETGEIYKCQISSVSYAFNDGLVKAVTIGDPIAVEDDGLNTDIYIKLNTIASNLRDRISNLEVI